MSSVQNVLVVGGGIGGLTAAIALRQNGVAVTVIERNPDHSVYGVGIIQPNNTLRALDTIGLAEACIDNGGAFSGWRLRSPVGEELMFAKMPNSAAPHLPPVNGITRPKLQNILLRAAESAGADIRVGVSVSRWSDNGSHVSATFSDGRSGRYDVLIGADGLFSQIRQDLFGSTVVPAPSGQSVWRYNFERPDEVDEGEIWYGSSTKIGLVPMSPKLMYTFVVTQEPGNPYFPREGMAAKLRDRLSEYGGLISSLREQVVDDDAVVYKPMEHLLLPDPWFRGRAIVIGDGAHATTPHLAQGAAMAIEDAVLLAELLVTDGPLQASLEEFMRRRFARAKYVIDASTQLADWELASWAGTPSPDENAGALIGEANFRLMEPY